MTILRFEDEGGDTLVSAWSAGRNSGESEGEVRISYAWNAGEGDHRLQGMSVVLPMSLEDFSRLVIAAGSGIADLRPYQKEAG